MVPKSQLETWVMAQNEKRASTYWRFTKDARAGPCMLLSPCHVLLVLFQFQRLHSKPHSAWRLHALKNCVEGLEENLGDSSLQY